jgi:hypothetical protein
MSQVAIGRAFTFSSPAFHFPTIFSTVENARAKFTEQSYLKERVQKNYYGIHSHRFGTWQDFWVKRR